ncbi:MAG: Smr/MutS family protein [Legionellaceae bacterium]|nr:Smr/MutS family protein [Legionellaceae bacterium]
MPKNNDVSDDEKAVFRESMRDVKPLRPSKKLTQQPEESMSIQKRKTGFVSRNSPLPSVELKTRSQQVGPVDNSSPEALRPAVCPRDPEILNTTKTHGVTMDRTGSRGQAAGRRDLNCQQTLPLTHYLSDYYHETVQADSNLSYCQPSIPKKRLLDLKNGLIEYEARLDLHGLNLDDARETLCHFFKKQLALQKRCLLIIHGKGGRHGETPILKNLVNHWLAQLPDVLAFHSALPKHGGTGAVYVLLKRYNLK